MWPCRRGSWCLPIERAWATLERYATCSTNERGISRAWTVVLAALDAGQAAGGGRKGIAAALEYLNSPNQQDFEQSTKRGMRRQLEAALTNERTTASADQLFRDWIDRAQRGLDAMNKHTR